MPRLLFLAPTLLCVTACGEAVRDDHFANKIEAERVEPEPIDPGLVPVRIGELGASFGACAAAGTTRHLNPAAGDRLPVRAAPFETGAQSGTIAAGARFFICTRSHDQRWLGIVYHESGALAADCGVSSPAMARANYQGPCPSGWVPAALVKQIAG